MRLSITSIATCGVLFSDITERTEAEKSLQDAKDELERRVVERTDELERNSYRSSGDRIASS